MPALDDQVIGWCADVGQDYFGDVQSERSRTAIGVVVMVDLDKRAGELGVTLPLRGISGRLERRAMECDARIAAYIAKLHRGRHHAQGDLTVGAECHLRTTDAWRSVATQSGESLVRTRIEAAPDPCGKVRSVPFDLSPAGQGVPPSFSDIRTRQWPFGDGVSKKRCTAVVGREHAPAE